MKQGIVKLPCALGQASECLFGSDLYQMSSATLASVITTVRDFPAQRNKGGAGSYCE